MAIYPKNRKQRPSEDRFWEKINKTESCWIWTGYRMPFGHGQMHLNGRTVLVHRFSWELHKGPIPEGIEVCHNCPGGDNPSCVNPDHLFLGTQADNMADAQKKGRIYTGGANQAAYGEDHGMSRLTEEQVIDILSLRNQGLSYSKIANRYGFLSQSIGEICRGETWSHIPRPQMTFTDAVRKLTEPRVIEILSRLKHGERQASLAREFGVDPGTIQSIVAGKSWKHIPRP